MGYAYGNDSSIASNCTVIYNKGNATQIQFEFDRGWEGIPLNFILNSVVFVVFMCLFAALRRKAWDTRKLSHTRIGWLQFIYGDRQSLPRANLMDARHNEHHSHGAHSTLLLPPPTAKKNGTRKGAENGSVAASQSVLVDGDAADVEVGVSNRRYQPLPPDGDNVRPASTSDDRFIRSLSIDSVTQMGKRLMDSIMIRDADIQRVKGIDAVQYLMFQRYILFFLSVLSCVCLLVILPINLQGELHDQSKPYARTTISNIETTSTLLWAHAIISILLVPFGVFLMWHFSRSIKSENERIARRTLFIRRIPKAKTKKDVIINFLAEKLPDIVVDGVQLVYNIKQLRALYGEHVNVVNAIGYCDEYLREYNEPCEIRPYFLGLFGGLCCCCKCCGKSDGLTYYREQELLTERALEKEFKETISNPVGSAFITFRTEKMAQTVFKYLRKQQRQNCGCLSCCEVCTLASSSCRDDDLSTGRWQTCYAPDPEDVNWDDISADLGMVWLRRILINLLLFVVFLFLTTPPILISIIEKTQLLGTITTGLSQLSPQLTSYVGPLLLVLVALILPVIVTFASTYLPYKTISEQNHSTMWKVFLFLVLMVLILPSLDLTSAVALIQVMYSVEFRWECLFPVGNGAFFINYVLQSALLGNAFELLRLPELIIYFYYTLIWTKSPAEYENARQQIMFDFQFGVRYPRFLLIFVMVVSYSLSCPLIAPCGLLYMGLKHLVDKYNIYYVYVPSKINDQIHSTAIMFFHIGLLTMQFQVFTFFFLRDQNHTGVTQLCMFSVIVAWIFFISHVFFNCFKSMSNSAGGVRKPNAKLDKSEFCACLYLPPVLYELNEHGIRAEPHNYGSMHARSAFDSHSDLPSTSGSIAADA